MSKTNEKNNDDFIQKIISDVAKNQTEIEDLKNDFKKIESRTKSNAELSKNVGELIDCVDSLTTVVDNKQNTLVAGENITIQNGTISANVDTTNLQPKLSAGSGINIVGNTISATNSTYTAGTGIAISDNTISADTTTLATKADLSAKQNTLSAGTGILIEGNQISTNGATVQEKLVAGNNITIENNVISATDTIYTAGSGISITNGVISSTASGGSGGGCDCAGDIISLDNRVSVLESKINKILPEYIETIYKETDSYVRELDISAQNEVFTPSVLFAMSDYLTYEDAEGLQVREYQKANLTINLNYEIDSADTVTFTVYNNATVLRTVTEFVNSENINTNQTISIKAVASASSKNQNVYVVCTTSSENTTITLTNMNITINAPNVSILNKIQPFEVMYNYYTNKYYFSDCTTGYAKLAEIDASNFTSLNDLTWTTTNIEAQNYKIYYVPETTMSSSTASSVVWKKYALIIHKNNTAEIVNIDDNTKRYTYPLGTYKLEPFYSRNGYLMVNYICANKNNIITQYNIIQHTMIATTTTTFTNSENLANVASTRNNLAYINFNPTPVHLLVSTNTGSSRFYNNRTSPSRPEIILSFTQDCKLHLYNFISQSNMKYHTYIKQFDKYYKFNSSVINLTFTLGDYAEVGEYDDLFEGLNGNLFVVINNQLQYIQNQ